MDRLDSFQVSGSPGSFTVLSRSTKKRFYWDGKPFFVLKEEEEQVLDSCSKRKILLINT